MTTSALDAALRYRELVYVIPLRHKEKRPSIAAWPQQATDDEPTIRSWFGSRPTDGVGCLMGLTPDSRFVFTLDIDEHDPEQSGSQSLAQLEARFGPLPETVETLTPNNGRHLYFYAPQPINKTTGKLGAGIDIQGHGSFVVAPPSQHPDGGSYRFRSGCGLGERPIANAPAWLVDLITTTPTAHGNAPTQTSENFWIDRSPADRFNDSITWQELLTEAGFTFHHRDRTGEEHWCRPGKKPSEGSSLTVGYRGLDIAHSFTSSISWLPRGTYTKFRFAAHLRLGGDMVALARSVIDAEKLLACNQLESSTGEWTEPIPLFIEPELPPFPVERLPQWLRNQVVEVEGDLQVDNALPACLGIGALSAVTLGNLSVTYEQQNWTQPTNTFICIAMDPSAGKSPAKAAMFKAVEDIEAIRMNMARSAVMKQESLEKVLDKKMRNVQDRLAKTSGADYDAATAELADLIDELAAIEQPPNGRMLVDDCTSEALAIVMKDAGGSIAQVSAEGGLFDRLAGLYNDGQVNLDLQLEGWSGGRFQQDRVTRTAIVIPRANLSITVTVQPSVLDDIGANRAMVSRGLVPRFLICTPPNNVGFRDRRRTSKPNPTVSRTYAAHLRDIADRCKGHPIRLTVGSEAADRFATWDQQHENLLRPGGEYEHIAMFIGKLRANILRIAALLHVAQAEDRSTHTIGLDTMTDAIAIGDYFLQHQLGLHARWGTDGAALQAKAILEWAIRNGHDTFTRRDLMRSLSRRFPGSGSTIEPIQRLVECGWVRAVGDVDGLQGRSKGTPSLALTLHPDAREYWRQHENHLNVSVVSVVSHKEKFGDSSLSCEESAHIKPNVNDTTDTTDNEPLRRSGLFDPEQ